MGEIPTDWSLEIIASSSIQVVDIIEASLTEEKQ